MEIKGRTLHFCYDSRTSGRVPWGETPRVADSSAAGMCHVRGCAVNGFLPMFPAILPVCVIGLLY